MHELSLSAAIADIVTRRAEGRTVHIVHIRIGQLRQVVPESLTFCWSLLTADTPLAGAALDIHRIAARILCMGCGNEFPLGEAISFVCPACGGLDTTVESGDEFDVMALDLLEV